MKLASAWQRRETSCLTVSEGRDTVSARRFTMSSLIRVFRLWASSDILSLHVGAASKTLHCLGPGDVQIQHFIKSVKVWLGIEIMGRNGGLTLEDSMMSDHELQLAGPRIHEAGPLGLQEYVAPVLDEKAVRLAAEGSASRLALLHNRLVGLLHNGEVLVVVEVHNAASYQVLWQIAQRTHRRTVHMRNNTGGRVADGELGALLGEDLVGN